MNLSALISIVVLNYNTRDLLIRCLTSITQYAPACVVIAIDNASSDGSAEAVRQLFPDIQLIANTTNLGFARAINQGLAAAAATSPFILALNADTELLPDTLLPLLKAAEDDPRAGILGPVQYLPVAAQPGSIGAPLASAFGDPTLVRETWRLLFFGDSLASRLKRGAWQPRTNQSPQPVNWLMGAALLFRRTCLSDIRGFDETQFMYGEDWDICYRARQLGWRVVLVPNSPLLHHENAAGRKHFGTSRRGRVLMANLYFHEKHFGRTSRRILAGLHLGGAMLRLGLLLPGRLLAKANQQARWQSQLDEARAARQGLRIDCFTSHTS